jgi:hypothetical protein
MQYADGLKLKWASHDFIRRGPKTAIQEEHSIAEAAKPNILHGGLRCRSSTSPLKTELSAAAVLSKEAPAMWPDGGHRPAHGRRAAQPPVT